MKVKSLIGVFSGKGGVGKSMISLNLAKSLSRQGYKVGLVDCDIYGPSQPIMMNATNMTLEVKDKKLLKPLFMDGISFMSMGLIAAERMPVIWRGPMVSGAVMQLLSQTEWGELDFLVIDTPPGTGDIQLTLMQRMPITGAIVITTPEQVSVADARKSIEMMKKLSIPLMGVVENMSYFKCSNCSERHHIFGEGGGELLAKEYDLDLVASFPLLDLKEVDILDDEHCNKQFQILADKLREKIVQLKSSSSEKIPQTRLKE